MAGIGGRDAIVGMAGELTKGMSTTVTVERAKPWDKLSVAEIETLLQRVQKEALEQVREQIAWETGLPGIDVRLVNSAVVSVQIDGHVVSNPIAFQGRHLSVTIFNAFAPLVHVGAMRTVVEALGLDLLSVVAEPYAVASALSNRPALDYGGIVIDIGGGTTDVALLRDGGIEGTKTFSLGGRAFTKRLAMRRSLSFEAAEELKLRYARGELHPTESQRISAALVPDVQTWMDGVALLLEELAGDGQIPPYLYLCGGTSGLPDLSEILQRFDWRGRLPMSRPAELRVLLPHDVGTIQDRTGELTGPQDVTPLSLAYQALALEGESGVVTEALHQTVQRMGIS
jgi:cell division protein FtsA